MNLEEIKKQVFVSCPFDLLKEKYLPIMVSQGINPEIGLNGTILDSYRFFDFFDVAKTLKTSGLKCTIHAPFTDIGCGAIDSCIRKVSLERLKQAVDLAVLFEAKSLVFHTGWERKIYADAKEFWLSFAIDTILALCKHARASNIPIALENVFELDTELHKAIFSKIPDDMLGFCLDAGHVYAFSKTPLNKWLDDLGPRIRHLHLHDNRGESDEHLAPRQGVIDFDLLFSWLSERGMRPVLTLEAHDEKTVIPGLLAVGELVDKYLG